MSKVEKIESDHEDSTSELQKPEIIIPPHDVMLKLINIIEAINNQKSDTDNTNSKFGRMFVVTPMVFNGVSAHVDKINSLLTLSLESKDGRSKSGDYRICVVHVLPPVFQIIHEGNTSNPIYVVISKPLPHNVKCPPQCLLPFDDYKMLCKYHMTPKETKEGTSTQVQPFNPTTQKRKSARESLNTKVKVCTPNIVKVPDDITSFESVLKIAADTSKDLKERQRIAIKKFEEKIILKHREMVRMRKKYCNMRDDLDERKDTSWLEIDSTIVNNILSQVFDEDACQFLLLQMKVSTSKDITWDDDEKLWALQLMKKHPAIYNFLQTKYTLPSKDVLKAFVKDVEKLENENR